MDKQINKLIRLEEDGVKETVLSEATILLLGDRDHVSVVLHSIAKA